MPQEILEYTTVGLNRSYPCGKKKKKKERNRKHGKKSLTEYSLTQTKKKTNTIVVYKRKTLNIPLFYLTI